MRIEKEGESKEEEKLSFF